MRRQTWWRVLAVLAVMWLMVGTTAAAGKGDKLVGSGKTVFSDSPIKFTVSARSGPSGEQPQGQVHFTYVGFSGKADVTCLSVSGNTAAVVARASDPSRVVPGADYVDVFLFVTDTGPAQNDIGDFGIAAGSGGPIPPPITTCSGAGVNVPVTQGNVTVMDATP